MTDPYVLHEEPRPRLARARRDADRLDRRRRRGAAGHGGARGGAGAPAPSPPSTATRSSTTAPAGRSWSCATASTPTWSGPTIELKAGHGRRRPRRPAPHRPRARRGLAPLRRRRPPTLAIDLGARMMVGLGAYPFATPHSRPSRAVGELRLARGGGRAELPEELRRRARRGAGRPGAGLRRPRACRPSGCGPRCRTTCPPPPTRRPAWPSSTGSARWRASGVDAAALRQEAEPPPGPPRRAGRRATPSTSPCSTSSKQAYDDEDGARRSRRRVAAARRRSRPATCRAATSWPPSWSGSSATRAAERPARRRARASVRSVRPGLAVVAEEAGHAAQAGDEQRLDHDVAGEPAQLDAAAARRWPAGARRRRSCRR